ncbi:FAD dependent oxidoreductase-domain-containing protein [Dactylonectria estremocensis]|uniref:FAD dependent oxidoreductase-domain-containing protein n=1 Tax=Dactylonectria estremocensis TaxID=1079267 RepID=A0A9P9DCC2_9HYPO|nr:FAD dependent oxidoreductase-domain-containing protein [Dactylonectria estremocensis]
MALECTSLYAVTNLSPHLTSFLVALAQQVRDRMSLAAGLPSENPTSPTWQQPPAPIASVQSPTLPAVTDIAIIGSGITGTSVAHTLLKHSKASELKVTILEARGACSGATGRNGGHLVSDTCGSFLRLVEQLGTEEAVKVFRFSEANITGLKAVVSQLSDAERDAVELREVIATCVLTDTETLEHSKSSLAAFQAAVKDSILDHVLSEDQDIIKNGLAVLDQKGAGALWPYRLITILQKRLLDSYANTFTLETNTPVNAITYEASENGVEYMLQTPRGSIRAKKVIHCTNGYSSHLLPSLTGKLYPLRGTVTVQDPGVSFPNLGNLYSWTLLHKPGYDPETRRLTTGLVYSQQNAKTGEIFIGGESQEIENTLNSDDSKVSESAKQYLSALVPKMYRDAEDAKTKNVWSGIMGFTSDGLPLVGNIGQTITGREGSNEWIAAGFNGHGMDKCWLSGEAVARMALGEEVPAWFPRSFLASEKRLESFTLDNSVHGLVSMFSAE